MGEVNKTLSSENKNLDKEVISFYDVKKLIEKNRIDEAIEMLNKMFVLTGDLKCQFELAKLYIKKHNYDEAINLLLSLARNIGIKSKTLCILDTSFALKIGFPFLSFRLPKSVFISNTVLFSSLNASTILYVFKYSFITLGNPPIQEYFKYNSLYN